MFRSHTKLQFDYFVCSYGLHHYYYYYLLFRCLKAARRRVNPTRDNSAAAVAATAARPLLCMCVIIAMLSDVRDANEIYYMQTRRRNYT